MRFDNNKRRLLLYIKILYVALLTANRFGCGKMWQILSLSLRRKKGSIHPDTLGATVGASSRRGFDTLPNYFLRLFNPRLYLNLLRP